MANRRKATSEARDQVTSQRPDLVICVAPPPPPVETSSPPAALVTQDQFASLVQQVQALAHLVQGHFEASHLAAPIPHLPKEDAAPVRPVTSSSGLHKVADPPHRPKRVEPMPQGVRCRDLPRSRRARSLSPVFSHHASMLSQHSPRLVPPAMPEEEIRRQLQEMHQELDAAKLAHPLQQKVDQGIPFYKEIIEEVIPFHVKLPAIKPYHGSSDPDDHLSSFRSIMMFHGASDAILCRAFPSTLRGSARTWFNALKQSSIGSFDELSRLFISQFVSSHRHRWRSDSLSEVKQREGESLKKYLGRFNTAMLEVDHLNHEVAMSALVGGVSKESDFYLALKVSYPQNLSDMMALADKYARVEESRRAARAELARRKEPKGSDKCRFTRQPSPPHCQRVPPPPPRNCTRSPPRRFNRFTPLTVPRAEILMEIERQLP